MDQPNVLAQLIEAVKGDATTFEETYCMDQQKVGLGSTRAVYRHGDYVIKKHLHAVGYQQSQNEQCFYRLLKEKAMDENVGAIHYVSESHMIGEYVTPLPVYDDGTGYDLHDFVPEEPNERYHPTHTAATDFLVEQGVVYDELLYSTNAGVNQQGFIVYVDYGMTHELSIAHQQGVENGDIPIYLHDECDGCREVKVCRVFDNQTEIICLDCASKGARV